LFPLPQVCDFIGGDRMYLRHSTVRKDGKAHTYWRLVRSVRRNGKVVQETVAQLGELDARGRLRAEALARHITGRADQYELFEERPGSERTIAVRLDLVRLERTRRFGDVWLSWTLWRALGLDRLCAELMPEGRAEVPWPTVAAVLVMARLCEPSSELHIAEDFYRTTALEDMLSLPCEQVNDDRLYRALDRLLPHKKAIEEHLRKRLGELFALEYDLLLYDVTSTFFEGLAERNPQAKRGHSRDHRPDCKQVCIALVVTREGVPLSYEVFDGNRVDVTTVEEIVGVMEARFGLADRIWVMDRGMMSRKNIAWLHKTGRRYVLGASRQEVKRWRQQIVEESGWQVVREGVEAKLAREGAETFVLCRSAERRQKEKAMHERFSLRIEEGLGSLARRIRKARRRLDRGPLERQIGRLLERNSRAAARFLATLVEDQSLPAGLRLDWSIRPDWEDLSHFSEGCYVLRTNVNDWSAEALWQTYIQLTQAESAFRIQKTELSIRPIWHQRKERVQAHIFVCFLAYVLWKTLEQWQKRAGLGHSPRTVLDELARLQSADVVLPTAQDPRRELRIRCVVRPDKAQAQLLDRLGLRLPERLRLLALPARM
jgi:transposase